MRGATLSFAGSFTDPGTLDTHDVTWDFGDGTVIGLHPSTDAGALRPTHVYTTSGTYTVTLTVLDDDTGVGVAQKAVIIRAAELETDPCDPTKTALVVGGTLGNDKIRIARASDDHEQHGDDERKTDDHGSQSKSGLEVWVNGQSLGVFRPTGSVIVYGQAGNDDIAVARNVTLPAQLHGGSGSDRLEGGGGPSVLVGDDGDDRLIGGRGRNVLIGGAGADDIVGSPGDDILISGTTRYDGDPEALCAILTEWNRTDLRRAQRVQHLTAGIGANGAVRLTAQTVQADTSTDVLRSGGGDDWIFADARDKVINSQKPGHEDDDQSSRDAVHDDRSGKPEGDSEAGPSRPRACAALTSVPGLPQSVVDHEATEHTDREHKDLASECVRPLMPSCHPEVS